MPAIYIDRRDAVLDADAGALVVRVDGERAATLPLAGADRVVVRRAGAVTLRLLASLGERGVGLLVLGGRKGEPMAHLLGLPHADAVIRRGQYALAAEPARSLDLARLAVRGKIAGHLTLLREAMDARPDMRKPLFDAAAEHERALEELGHAADLDALRGREGGAAASFFRGFIALFPPALGFVERNRRPPRDPVNACLSLAYTLLHAEAVRAAWVAGLDPLVGFLHALLSGRESLACDLVEFGRPGMDRLVWRLFRDRALRAEHFATVEGACLMGKSGRALFYEAYESAIGAERRRLRHVAAGLARLARGAAHRP